MTVVDWWFIPCFMLAVYNTYLLYRLDAPFSLGSRVARTLGVMACIVTIFSPLEMRIGIDFLSELSFLLLFTSYATQNTQFLLEEGRKYKKMKTAKPLEKVVSAIVQRPNERNGGTL